MDDALRRGQVALTDGDWGAARACFEQALRERTSAKALDGLAQALFSLGDYADAIIVGEQAFAAYRERGEDVRAAACARVVGYLYAAVHGNAARAGGWIGRAVNLIAAAGDCPERARIELTRAVVATDPTVRDRHLSAAVEIAHRCGATDIVFDAMSQRGLQRVAAGEIDAGMALLDESLAAVAGGEVRDLVSVGAMYCKMLHACELTSDVRRAQEWLAHADGFVARTDRLPISAICRTHYGGVLTAAGRWIDAERELVTALRLYDRSYRALRGAALCRLAALRVRQGRLAEAAELLVDVERDAYAVRPFVELHLARGEAELAAARAERYLRERGRSELAAPLLHLLVRAEVDRGDISAARTAAAQLRQFADAQPHRLTAALADHADGLVAATERHPTAVHHLESALAGFGRLELPLEEARARLDLAHALTAERPAMARIEARAALTTFQELAATRDAHAATSLLRSLGVRGHTGPRGDG
ncbi:MAG TPA: hypothetical protein VGD56_20925, partial [Gemmatirosa sp.]